MSEFRDSQEQDESYGIALGIRVFDDDGEFYFAEAEITPYVDEPEALGATLVFHSLEGIDPVAFDDETDRPAWPIDIDEDLTRDPEQAMRTQFRAILRQLSSLSVEDLRRYMHQAREQAENGG